MEKKGLVLRMTVLFLAVSSANAFGLSQELLDKIARDQNIKKEKATASRKTAPSKSAPPTRQNAVGSRSSTASNQGNVLKEAEDFILSMAGKYSPADEVNDAIPTFISIRATSAVVSFSEDGTTLRLFVKREHRLERKPGSSSSNDKHQNIENYSVALGALNPEAEISGAAVILKCSLPGCIEFQNRYAFESFDVDGRPVINSPLDKHTPDVNKRIDRMTVNFNTGEDAARVAKAFSDAILASGGKKEKKSKY